MKGYYDCGYDKLMQGVDPNDYDEPESYITNDSRCSNCGHWFDESELETLGFVVEDSGVQPGTPDGPAVHWAYGVIICPNCQDRLPYETSD